MEKYEQMDFEELTRFYEERTGKNYRESFGEWDEDTMKLILSADLWARDFYDAKKEALEILIQNNKRTLEAIK